MLVGRALRIEHVGSTAVPGLPAKPVIDVLLVISNSANEESYVPLLESGGYVLRIREPEWFEHRMFNAPDTAVNLHVFSRGCEEIDRMLFFRDWLRQNPTDRDLYASAKGVLAQREWQNIDEYAHAKTAVIQEILERAAKGV